MLDFAFLSLLWVSSIALSLSVLWLSRSWLYGIGLVDLDWFKPKEYWVPIGGVLLWVPVAIVGMALGFLGVTPRESFEWVAVSLLLGSVGIADDLGRKLRKRLGWAFRAVPIAVICLGASFFLAQPFSFFGFFSVSSPPLLTLFGALFIAGLLGLENSFGGINGWNGGASFFVSLGVIALVFNTPFLPLAVAFSGIIAGFAWLYKYPALVFPGDSQPYLTGAAFSLVLLFAGKMDWGLLLYLPHLLDFFLLKLLLNKGDVSQKATLKVLGGEKETGVRPYALLSSGELAIPKYADGFTRYDFAKFLIKLLGPQSEQRLMHLIWLVVAANALIVSLAHYYFAAA